MRGIQQKNVQVIIHATVQELHVVNVLMARRSVKMMRVAWGGLVTVQTGSGVVRVRVLMGFIPIHIAAKMRHHAGIAGMIRHPAEG